MEMELKEFIKYTKMGIESQINSKVKSLKLGEKILMSLNSDNPIKTDKTEKELLFKIQSLKVEIENLYRTKDELDWYYEIGELKIK